MAAAAVAVIRVQFDLERFAAGGAGNIALFDLVEIQVNLFTALGALDFVQLFVVVIFVIFVVFVLVEP